MANLSHLVKPINLEQANEILSLYNQYGNATALAKALGKKDRTVREWVLTAKEIVFTDGKAPPKHFVKATSTLYDAEGNKKLEWIKTDRQKESFDEIKDDLIEAFNSEIKPLKPIKKSTGHDKELMVVIPMGDPHIGLYCSEWEVGEKFNLEIAKADLCNAVKYLIDAAPKADRCAIINLGDFFHADNFAGVTSRSGHSLDMAGRAPEMIEVGVTAMRYCIEYATEKFNHVDVINAIGNHDDLLSIALSCLLHNVYQNNPRIKIHNEPRTRHYLRHGNVFIGVTHGNSSKDKNLPLLMATEKAKEWGETKYRFFYRGHHHHDEKIEYNGCIVEQFRTLAPSDSYAFGNGYISGRDIKAILMHSKYGEVGRITCSIDMLRGEK